MLKKETEAFFRIQLMEKNFILNKIKCNSFRVTQQCVYLRLVSKMMTMRLNIITVP